MKLLLFALFAAAVTSAVASTLPFCPSSEEIRPCTCSTFTGIEFHCHGPLITQAALQNLFDVIRSYDPAAHLKSFSMMDTTLLTMDVGAFTNLSFRFLMLNNNKNLTTITVPSGTEVQINVTSLRISNSPLLRNNGFSSVLVPSSLKTFAIMLTSIVGNEGPNFLPGLTKQDQLDTIQLESSDIFTPRIGSGQFRKYPKITHIALTDIGIEQVDSGAFEFDEYPAEFSSALHVGLKRNLLTDSSIPIDHGLDKIKYRNVIWYLEDNKLETLSQAKFEPFLKSGATRNQLRVYDNAIVCDERVKWLKDGKQIYQSIVIGPDCVNDPGKTVFTSDLIP